MRFSQRMSQKPIKIEIQIDSIDDDLKNGLWNIIDTYFFNPFSISANRITEKKFFEQLYGDFLKLPLDTIFDRPKDRRTKIRSWFYEWPWYEVYDFIEFAGQFETHNFKTQKFRALCNEILERELSGYRFIDKFISPITDTTELKEIEEAIETSRKTKFSASSIHLETALLKLSNRKNPDYRNSIKESISAVEALAQIIADNPKAKLSQALNIIEEKVALHPALKKGFLAIYGYTSDADGIRHALTENSNCDFDDAKYMLVSCSAFVNYLIMKTMKATII